MKKLKFWIRKQLIFILFGKQIKEISYQMLYNDDIEVFNYIIKLLISDQHKMENANDFILGYYNLNHAINKELQKQLTKEL